MIQLPAAPCPSDTDTPWPPQGVWDRMLAFSVYKSCSKSKGGYLKYQSRLCYGLCLQGGSGRMSQMAFGKGSLVSGMGTAPYKVIHAHTGESSRGFTGVQVCPSESSASAWDRSCPKEQESRWQLEGTKHRDRSPARTQSDTGSPRLGAKGG